MMKIFEKKLECELLHTDWNLYDDDIKSKSDIEEKYTNLSSAKYVMIVSPL